MNKNISTIIFDWAGVFCSAGEPFSHPELPRLTGSNVDEMGERTKDLQDRYYRGKLSSNEFWQRVIKRFNITTLAINDLRAAYLDSYTVYPEMFELAEDLKKRFTTILLSNLTPEMMDDIVAKHNVKRYFHHTIFSNEVGFVKPEPEMFRIALERAGTEPEQTLFIDDGKKNVEAARSLGMHTILFLSSEQCKVELQRLGVIP